MRPIFLAFLLFGMFQSGCNRKNGCPNKLFSNADDRLQILNKSNHPIYFDVSFYYPDTTLNRITEPHPEANPGSIALPAESSSVFSRSCWCYVFKDQIPSGKIQIFIFDLDVIKNEPWNSIIADYKILKRFTYTYDELRAINWTVVYE